MESFPFLNFENPKKRHYPTEIDLDQSEIERAKRRLVSEFLSSELTALSLREDDNFSYTNNSADLSTNSSLTDELRELPNQIKPDGQIRSIPRQKHVLMVNNLDVDASDSDKSDDDINDFDQPVQMPRELRKSLKKIPKELLVTRTYENPVRDMVLYRRPIWVLPEHMPEETRIENIASLAKNGNGKDPNEEYTKEFEMEVDAEPYSYSKKICYDGYLGDEEPDSDDKKKITLDGFVRDDDNDDDSVEEMELDPMGF
ncbi:hypothetical protein G9A89_003225 [Geosiphon pyriformis]|nr:hypothetical protein G9A89_003225 [Geosiphon pyriformis]